MSLSDYGENQMLNTFAAGGTYYLALFTAAPADTGGGVEVSGGGYARQGVTFGTASDGTIKNTNVMEFPTATENWGTCTAWGLFDASSGGNLVWYGAVAPARELIAGDIYRVNVGNLVLMLD